MGFPMSCMPSISTNKKAFTSTPPQGGIFGTAGPAIGNDGTIYFETGDGAYDVAAGKLSTTVQAYTSANDTLTLKDYYTPSNHAWLTKRDLDMNTTPSSFLIRDGTSWLAPARKAAIS